MTFHTFTPENHNGGLFYRQGSKLPHQGVVSPKVGVWVWYCRKNHKGTVILDPPLALDRGGHNVRKRKGLQG